ncbi:MAG: RNA recognition motif domain-containing protein [Planctomycetota bacterium]|eukprot:Skav212825  [mRNA]  locus=scaffold8141:648:941:- [translate_table: standard]
MGNRLYVGNLSFHSTEDSLTEAFSQDARKVSSVSIMTDRDTGQSRGFAFVEMATEEDAQAAIQAMDGKDLDGRTLRVNEAQERNSGGGSRGRGRSAW